MVYSLVGICWCSWVTWNRFLSQLFGNNDNKLDTSLTCISVMFRLNICWDELRNWCIVLMFLLRAYFCSSTLLRSLIHQTQHTETCVLGLKIVYICRPRRCGTVLLFLRKWQIWFGKHKVRNLKGWKKTIIIRGKVPSTLFHRLSHCGDCLEFIDKLQHTSRSDVGLSLKMTRN